MPVWTVTLRVNVPGMGEQNVDIVNIAAETIEDAIALSYKAVVVIPIAALQTATAAVGTMGLELGVPGDLVL